MPADSSVDTTTPTDLKRLEAGLDNLETGGRQKTSAKSYVARLLSPLGAGGGSLLASAEAGRQLRDVLPGALSQAATGEALEGGAVGSRVRAAEQRRVGQDGHLVGAAIFRRLVAEAQLRVEACPQFRA